MKIKSWPSTGIANKSNFRDWADYAKGNSYQCDKAELKANLSPGGRADAENDWSKDWKQPQRKEEGRGWTKDSVNPDQTYTGKNGSKRD